MPDSKITALTALTAADPANDMIPIVDVSDTPPASGNTKRISINNILACSPTATLASATISGDLTVRTNKLAVTSTSVGIGTASPTLAAGVGLEIENAGIATLRLQNTSGANAFELQVDSDANGVLYRGYNNSPHVFYVNNSTAMILNSTGLGVGAASPNFKLDVAGAANSAPITLLRLNNTGTTGGGPGIAARLQFNAGATALGFVQGCNFASGSIGVQISGDGTNIHQTIDSSGNVGIGVTPSYLLHTAVASGANRNIARFQVTGASNGLTITWNHATTKMIVNFSNLPTSSAGLASSDLWIDTAAGNTLKVA